MKPKPVVLAALILATVAVSAEYAAVAGKIGRAADALATRSHAHSAAGIAVVATKLLVRAIVCAASS